PGKTIAVPTITKLTKDLEIIMKRNLKTFDLDNASIRVRKNVTSILKLIGTNHNDDNFLRENKIGYNILLASSQTQTLNNHK
ncbi:12285_t:CDS:2, partial [Racocetra fulgida]